MASKARPEEPVSQFLTHAFQSRLALWNRERLTPALPAPEWRETLERDHAMLRLKGAFLEELRAEVADARYQAVLWS